MNKVILRAITAFSRTDLKDATSAVAVKGREVSIGGKGYVILESEKGHEPVAVYRCMNRGELKRLKRWPSDLTLKNEAPIQPNARPAILELSPVKKPPKKVNAKPSKSSTNKNQTDLFD